MKLIINWYRVFELALRQTDEVPDFVREYQFTPLKKWRIDFAWPDSDPRLAVEIEGVNGYNKDQKKYNSLAIHGYFLLRCTPQQIENGEALDEVIEFFQVRREMA